MSYRIGDTVFVGGAIGVGKEAAVATRTARGARLAAPALLLPSIQVSIRVGRLAPAEANGVRYVKVPLRVPNEALAAAMGGVST